MSRRVLVDIEPIVASLSESVALGLGEEATGFVRAPTALQAVADPQSRHRLRTFTNDFR
jgi:hypothetical protein